MKYSLSSRNIKKLLQTKPLFSNSLCLSFSASSDLALGFSLGRWSGSAVVRNKFKRVARLIFINHQKNKDPLHVLVKPKRALFQIKDFKNEFLFLLDEAQKAVALENE